MSPSWRRIAFVLAVGVPACRYSVDPDTGKFHCAANADCGDGWHCFSSCPLSGFTPYCVQNGGCDPCPSLQGDPANCGSCGHACPSGEACVDALCVPAVLADGGPNGGIDGGDAGADAGSADAGRAGGVDAGADGGFPDASVDAGTLDAGGLDGGEDAGGGGGPTGDGGATDGGPNDGGADAGDGGA